jgi:hypothetical protein
MLDGGAVVLDVDGVSDVNALHSREPAQCRLNEHRFGEAPLNTACHDWMCRLG